MGCEMTRVNTSRQIFNFFFFSILNHCFIIIFITVKWREGLTAGEIVPLDLGRLIRISNAVQAF